MAESPVAVYILRPPTPIVSPLMIVCLWSGKLGFESLSGNPRCEAGFRRGAARLAQPQTDTRPITSEKTVPKRRPHVDSSARIHRLIFRCIAGTMLALIVALLLGTRPAQASAWHATTATWYGPSFYGSAFACSYRRDVPNRYSETHSRGVAHMTLPCGTKLTVCRGRRCVQVQVIDSGAFDPDNIDLTARTARDLIGCRNCKPYTQRVRWMKGWT